MTDDLANRSSCVHILKQPGGFQLPPYLEGDLLAHVRANQPRYLGAVFAVIRDWHAAGKPKTDEPRHDFRAWAQPLDWIVQHLLHAAALLDGHRETQQRMTNPALNWLRDVALAAVAQSQCRIAGSPPSNILELADVAGLEIPGLGDKDLSEERVHQIVVQQIGKRLGRCFGDNQHLKLDDLVVHRERYVDDRYRERFQYWVSRNAEHPRADEAGS